MMILSCQLSDNYFSCVINLLVLPFLFGPNMIGFLIIFCVFYSFPLRYVVRNDDLACAVSSYPPSRDGAGFVECAAKAYQIMKDVLTKE